MSLIERFHCTFVVYMSIVVFVHPRVCIQWKALTFVHCALCTGDADLHPRAVAQH